MTLSTLPTWARELIEEVKVGRLAFVDDADRPRALPVTFALHDDAIWSAIDQKPKRPSEPARIRYLRRRPAAALLVDVYSDNWDELAWVQVLGAVAVIDVEQAMGAMDALADKYEPYRNDRPPGPLLRLDPEHALCWRAKDR